MYQVAIQCRLCLSAFPSFQYVATLPSAEWGPKHHDMIIHHSSYVSSAFSLLLTRRSARPTLGAEKAGIHFATRGATPAAAIAQRNCMNRYQRIAACLERREPDQSVVF